MGRMGKIAVKIASDYVLTEAEKNGINDLIGGLILYLRDETDALVPAFVIGDMDISIYEAKYERGADGMLIEDSPAGYEVNDYTVEFVRNPENHELMISYKQLLDKLDNRRYEWDWADLKDVEKENIRELVKVCVASRDWQDVDRTYVYDKYYGDAILREGTSRVKLGVKCEEDYFTVFVLKAKPGDDVVNEAIDWLANREYKKTVLNNPLSRVVGDVVKK